MAAQAAGFTTLFYSVCIELITPVSSIHGCDESHQTPIRIKRAAMTRPVALAALPPQKNVGATPCPMGSSQTRGCRFPGTNPLMAHVVGDPLLLQIGDDEPASHSDQMAVTPVPKSGLAGRRRDSCEAALHVKWLLLLQNMEAGSRQFVGQCLDGDHGVGFRFLAFIKPLGLDAVAQGKVGGFDKRPRQILVAVFGVSFALLFAVSGAHTVDTTRVRCKVSGRSEAANRPRFEQNRRGQHLANTRYAGEESVVRSPFVPSRLPVDAFQGGQSVWKVSR